MTEPVVPFPVSVARRVLIVEDEALIAESLVEIVTDMGFECVGPVFDVAKAIDLATTETLDAAILNLIIRGGTAYGVAAILDSRGIPFAFASGVPHDGLESDWQNRPFIDKPYSSEHVQKILQTLIPHHSWPAEQQSPVSAAGLTPEI